MANFPTTVITATYAKPLSSNATASSVKQNAISLLQDHESMIKLNPLVVRYKQIEEAGRSADTKTYIITDKLLYLPFGLWDSELNYTTEFTNTPEGLRTLSHAPLGFVVESRWGVREREDGGGWAVEEHVEGRVPWALKWFVEGTMAKAHKTVLAKFIEKAERMEKVENRG